MNFGLNVAIIRARIRLEYFPIPEPDPTHLLATQSTLTQSAPTRHDVFEAKNHFLFKNKLILLKLIYFYHIFRS